MGLNVQLVASGERKTDGNPNAMISADALLASQKRVDDLADMFFALVAGHGWGGSVDALRGMQAGIVHGLDAVSMGLATEIATLDQSIAFASPSDLRSGTGAGATEGKYNMPSPMEDAVASLRKAAEGDDEEEARKAKAALAALDDDDDNDDDEESRKDDDAKSQDDDDDDNDDAKSQDDDDDDEDEESKAAAAKGAAADSEALTIAAQALAKVQAMENRQKKEKANAEREELIASRPDFGPDLVKVLRNPKTPMATVRELCGAIETGPPRKDRVAAAALVTGTRGKGQGEGGVTHLPIGEKAALDLKMGLTEMTLKTIHAGNRMSFGVSVPVTQEGK